MPFTDNTNFHKLIFIISEWKMKTDQSSDFYAPPSTIASPSTISKSPTAPNSTPSPAGTPNYAPSLHYSHQYPLLLSRPQQSFPRPAMSVWLLVLFSAAVVCWMRGTRSWLNILKKYQGCLNLPKTKVLCDCWRKASWWSSKRRSACLLRPVFAVERWCRGNWVTNCWLWLAENDLWNANSYLLYYFYYRLRECLMDPISNVCLFKPTAHAVKRTITFWQWIEAASLWFVV